MMRRIRNFIRKQTGPIPEKDAFKTKNRLSAIYYFTAWNTFIFVLIYTLRQHNPETDEDKKCPTKYYAKVAGVENAEVIKYRGFTKIGEYEITGMTQKQPDKTAAEREEEEREQEFSVDKMDDMREREYLGLPAADDFESELLRDEPSVYQDIEMKDSEDWTLLLEETSSL